MSFRSTWRWGAAAAGLLVAGAGAVLAAGSNSCWQVTAASAGTQFYAWLFDLGQRLPLAFLVPVIAMSISFHAGSRIAHHARRRAEARVMVAPRPPMARYAILFCIAAFMSLVFLISRGLLG